MYYKKKMTNTVYNLSCNLYWTCFYCTYESKKKNKNLFFFFCILVLLSSSFLQAVGSCQADLAVKTLVADRHEVNRVPQKSVFYFIIFWFGCHGNWNGFFFFSEHHIHWRWCSMSCLKSRDLIAALFVDIAVVLCVSVGNWELQEEDTSGFQSFQKTKFSVGLVQFSKLLRFIDAGWFANTAVYSKANPCTNKWGIYFVAHKIGLDNL